MEINWFTVIAQIINFLILVWLLKRFLYKPVLDAIDERQKKIVSQLNDAAIKKADAKKEQQLFLQKNEDFDKECATKRSKAHEEVNSEKKLLLEEVRKESTMMRSKYEDDLKEHEHEVLDTLKRKTKDEVFAIASKTLADLADSNLERQIIQVFINRIRVLDDENKIKLKTALNNNHKAISIRSAFELTATSKQELEDSIEKITERQNNYKYLLESELVCGIEIITEGFQLSWNIDSYLNSLKKLSITKGKKNGID